MASAASPIANRNRATDATSPSVGVVDIASPLKAHVEATLVTSPMKMRKSAIPTLDSAPSPQHTGSIPSVSIVASIAAITSAAESDGQWRYAYEQVRRLLPHSESVAPWQQHAFALLSCAEIAMRLGEPADACGFASDAVALHVAVSCDAASVMARLTAAKAFEKSGRRMESRDMYRSACTIVEKGIASAEQTFHSSTVVVPLDAALPFVEFANFLSNCGSDESRVDLLKQALKQCPTTKRTLCQAHLLLARASVAESELTEADAHYERAVTTAANDDQLCDVLAEASQFAQHKLRSIEKAVTYYNRLFDVRPPEVNACAHRGELLLNAGVCFEQHPSHGSARAVGLYRLAIANFPPKSPNTHRMRLYLARAYGGSGQVDRAVEEYSSLIHDMSAIRDEVMQIDVNGVRGFLPLCEVFGHLALCLFQRAGDLQGAAVQYQQAFEASESRRPAPPARTLEWLHEGCGALYLRMGHYQEALQHLEEKIELASRRNDPAVDAHLHAAAAYESLRKPEAAMDVYKYLFDLPITASTREHRLEVTLRFAWLCHYTLADFEAAVTLYLAALHIDADNPHTMVQAAWCMLQLPQHDQAEIEALYSSAALAVETAKHGQVTGQWDECYVLGECAVFHHDVTKKAALAEELYTAALACKTSENFAQVAANFAVFLHYERKETARAMTWFESAIASNPHLPAATTLFADFLIHTNQLDRAVEELQKLLPTNRAEAWHKLGRIAERVVVQDSYDTAIAAYCKALGAPDDETVMTDEAVLSYISKVEASQLPIATDLVMLLHYKTRKIELIDKIYSELINKFKTEVHLLMHYARFCVDVMKKRKKAHRLFRNAVALDPSNVTVLDHYAEFLASSDPQRLDAAEAVHLQSVRLNPNSAAAHFSYASFLTYVYKAPARAEVHFKTALNIDPTDSLTLCCYATFLESQADQHGPSWKLYQQTIDCTEWMHREAVKLAPTNANHGVFLANFLWRQRRHTDAWEPLHTALQLEPGNVVTLRLAATFLHDWYTTVAASGGTCEAMDSNTMAGTAEALFKRAVSLSPNDVQTLRAFAKFMDEVRHDHVTATSIDAAATQIELAEHDAAITSAENEPSDSDA